VNCQSSHRLPSGMVLHYRLSSKGWQRRINTTKGLCSTKINREKNKLFCHLRHNILSLWTG
jgi:hypothetical protein